VFIVYLCCPLQRLLLLFVVSALIWVKTESQQKGIFWIKEVEHGAFTLEHYRKTPYLGLDLELSNYSSNPLSSLMAVSNFQVYQVTPISARSRSNRCDLSLSGAFFVVDRWSDPYSWSIQFTVERWRRKL
jgi:hypothetical protein